MKGTHHPGSIGSMGGNEHECVDGDTTSQEHPKPTEDICMGMGTPQLLGPLEGHQHGDMGTTTPGAPEAWKADGDGNTITPVVSG